MDAVKDIIFIINKLNKKIKSLYSGFNGIYLYGSYAKGYQNEKSDIDLVAIFNKTPNIQERMNLWKIVGKFEAEFDIILDLHPMSELELEQNPIYYNQVVNKGIFYGI